MMYTDECKFHSQWKVMAGSPFVKELGRYLLQKSGPYTGGMMGET